MQQKNNWSRYVRLLLVVGFLVLPVVSQAVSFDPAVGDKTGLINSTTGTITAVDLGKTTPTVVAFNIINAALSLLAVLCLVLLLYAGFLWIWARGNQDEVKKSKDIIVGTVLGLIIVLASLGITTFVFKTIAQISGATVTS